MIAIYAMADDYRAVDAFTALRKQAIPCCLIGPEYGHASVIPKVPFLFIGDGCEKIVSGFNDSVPEAKCIRTYKMLCADGLKERLKLVYGLDFTDLTCGGIRMLEKQFYFFGNRILLTEREKLIVRHLTLCRGIHFTAEELSAFCFDGGDGSTVAVHICNINAKNRASATERIIHSKRYKGYFIK